ncbi:amino acid ABC transporter permease [Nocardioides panacisoli]|uniref:Amino acid ABC transporter permease n=1 Tax=Nocardioides panacisoli TaxID=627624 RepID=A0ABP7IN06_9ACTN
MKRTTRRRLVLVGLNVLVLAFALAAVLLVKANWDTIGPNFWSPGRKDTWRDLITTGVKNTVIYTVIAFSGGLVLAVALALGRLSPVFTLRWVATAYIEFFRGLPALLVISFMAYGPEIAFGWRPPGGLPGAGLLALILVASAYMAETVRAGIQAVPRGQSEAARSLGMGGGATMVRIILPQAFRVVIPPLTNEFVLLIKDTALLSVIGVQLGQRELTTVARDFESTGATAQTSTSLVQAALIYLVITIPLTQLVSWLERRQRRATR